MLWRIKAQSEMKRPKSGGPSDWISNGEKYALVGLEVQIEEHVAFREIVEGLWAWAGDTQTIAIPALWQEWLGSIRAEEIGGCNLVLVSKIKSRTPAVLDAENQYLQKRVQSFY